jgi:riboflavin kinase/FMN adenylyltransferase
MQLYFDIEHLPRLRSRPAVSVGNFDGVHLGHQALMATLKKVAMGAPAIAITFNPHPLALLRPDKTLAMIHSLEQRCQFMIESGAEMALCLKFTHELANLRPHDFILRILVEKLNAAHVVEGYNFNFGKNGQGNVALLRQLAPKYGYVVHLVEPVLLNSAPVSSSRVRQAVAAGNLAAAEQMLGRWYQIKGKVAPGEGRGRKLGVPTANLELDTELLLPPLGVYAAQVTLPSGQEKTGIFNLGLNPTFNALVKPRLEVHVMDFDGDLYGQNLLVRPRAFLRDERKFSSPQALMEQMARDIAQARACV